MKNNKVEPINRNLSSNSLIQKELKRNNSNFSKPYEIPGSNRSTKANNNKFSIGINPLAQSEDLGRNSKVGGISTTTNNNTINNNTNSSNTNSNLKKSDDMNTPYKRQVMMGSNPSPRINSSLPKSKLIV